jgi:heavy metal sensor kinase
MAAIVVAAGGFLVVRLRSDLLQGLDATLVSRAQQITLALSEGQFADIGDAPSLAGIPRGDSVAQILSVGGNVLETSGEVEAEAPLVDRTVLQGAKGGPYRATVPLGREAEQYRVLAVPLSGGKTVLVVADSTDSVAAAVSRVIALLVLAGPAAVALSAIGGYILAARAFGPMDRMTRNAAAIGMHDTSVRLEVPAIEDEVGRLGRTLNQMLARLDDGIVEQRRFAADASHELRTPLSNMRSEIDVSLESSDVSGEGRRALTSLGEEVDRMTAIVADLLMLARMDGGGATAKSERVDLLSVARGVTERVAARAEAKRMDVDVQGESSTVMGDADQLAHLLSNLVDNALKYTPDRGSVLVRVTSDHDGAAVSVTDSGIGISADALPHVFDRFYRADKARSRDGGTGLGLAICRSIVEAHRGTITLDSEPGHGTTVTVRLGRGTKEP